MQKGTIVFAWYTQYEVDAGGYIDFTKEQIVYMGEATDQSCKAVLAAPPLADAFNLGVVSTPCIVRYDTNTYGIMPRLALDVNRSVRVHGKGFEVEWPAAFPGGGWTAVLPEDEIYLTPTEKETAGRFKQFCCKTCIVADDNDMVGCENDECSHGKWFHLDCVGLDAVPEGAFYCEKCVATL